MENMSVASGNDMTDVKIVPGIIEYMSYYT